MGGMKSLSTDPVTDGAPLTSVERAFFDDLAKEAADTSPNDNEGEMVEGTTPEPAPVEGRDEGPEAPWGEEPGKVTNGQQPDPAFTSVARKEFIRGRQEMLDKLFEHKPKDTQHREVSPSSLGERVRKLTGRD